MPGMNPRVYSVLPGLLLLVLAACSDAGGAVVFAPTPPPPDESALTYTHPGGAFQIDVPRLWAVDEQNTTQLASASFSPPGSGQPLLTVSAVNLGESAAPVEFGSLIDRYQAEIRPDHADYTETGRAAMGDGSWRLSGYRTTPGADFEAVNTFIERAGPLLAVTDVTLPSDAPTLAALEAAANSLRLTPPGALEPAALDTLAFTRSRELAVVHTSAWTTPDGVFYVTGEISNPGPVAWQSVPVEVTLTTPDGTVVQGALDQTLGHAVPAGGFAPFSLRFGSQPDSARRFVVRVGGDGWTPAPAPAVLGAESLAWTDATSYEGEALVVSGEVTNTSAALARQVRATVTVFDAAGHVIGVASSELPPPTLAPGERVPYRFILPELGGTPAQYAVNVQALP